MLISSTVCSTLIILMPRRLFDTVCAFPTAACMHPVSVESTFHLDASVYVCALLHNIVSVRSRWRRMAWTDADLVS